MNTIVPTTPHMSGHLAPTARPMDGRPGEGECLCSGSPHHARPPPPPRTHSRRPRGAQSHLARVRTAGLVTGPQTRTCCARTTMAAGPDCSPGERAAEGGRVFVLRHPLPRLEAPPGHTPAALAVHYVCKGTRAVGPVTDSHTRTHHTHNRWAAGGIVFWTRSACCCDRLAGCVQYLVGGMSLVHHCRKTQKHNVLDRGPIDYFGG